MSQVLRALPLLLLGLLLAGCAHEPVRTPPDWTAHVAEVSARTHWELQGKIGLRAASRGGSAFLSWRQQSEDYRLVLSGALGLGKLVINGGPDGVRWTDSSGRERHFSDPEVLISEAWGWQVPVAALQYWIRGIPQPGAPIENASFANGLASRFTQAGWTVLPEAYRSVEGIQLPSRVRLEGRDAVLTVSVSRWNTPSP